nr:putative ribonuclease H-like domain-containing protein [Tanacetum cinerariifolium]
GALQFKMEKFIKTHAEGIEGTQHIGPERDRVFADLTLEEKKSYTMTWNTSIRTKEKPFMNTMSDQLYAYLKQHVAHANENKMMLERYTQHAIDPLAFVSNISPQQYPTQSSAILQSAYVPPVTHQPKFADNTQLDLGTDLQFKTTGLLFKMFKVDKKEARGTMQGEQLQLEIGDFRTELGMKIMKLEYFKDKMLLMQAQENGVVLDEEQLLFIAAYQCDASDSDVDEAPTVQTMFMENLSSADPIYDEAGPSYDLDILSESALYNGHKIVKTNHSPAIMHDSKDTLEIAEKTRKKMFEKMKSPLCVGKQVKIAPPDYSKENYLATFTPQRHLTPEQIFWSSDILIPKPISEMMVYPPNTPARLIPRRITPCSLTEGEMGFEQTKECYLTEVISFFKMLKEHFEGIQTDLVKEMKGIIEQMEAEVEQNDVDKQCADIERKNILIENENLIVDVSNSLLEEFGDELARISYPPDYDDYHACDIESDIGEIEFLLFQSEDSNFKDSIDQSDFSRDDVLFSPDNEDKVFNPGILSHAKSVKIITRVTQEKKLAVSFASWLFEDFYPSFSELLVFKEVPISMRLLPFSYEKEEKDFKPGIYTFKKVHCYFLSELSHPDVDGVELLKGSRGFYLYTISVEDIMKSSPICLLLKASNNKSRFWHRRLNHLNIGTINDLARKYLESVGTTHQKSVPRTPQQNAVVKRQNHTLMEAARTMLIFSKALMFLWAEVVANACYTQNRSLIHT